MPSHAQTALPSALPRTAGTQTFLRSLRTWYVERQTRRALMQLTPREMADVGVTPDTIDAIAARVARQ